MARLLINIFGIAVIALITLTIWATGKSHERTECYKAAKDIADCEQPGSVERLVRSVSGG